MAETDITGGEPKTPSSNDIPGGEHRYHRLYLLIQCIPYTDHKFLKHLMKKEINAHLNCCNSYNSCNQNCGICPYHNIGWANMESLIDRVMTDKAHILNKNIVAEMRVFIAATHSCPTLLKTGMCGHNCTSCGL